MINKPLFLREVKANYKILLLFFAIITMYTAIITAMFDPTLGNSLKIMSEGMPELFAAFGMNSFSSVLVEFLADMLYGLILVLLPMLAILLFVHRLMIRYIDRGSMAYLLATPNSRGKIVRTQAFLMVLIVLIICIYTTVIGIVVSAFMFPGELEIHKFILLNIGLFCLLFFLSGVSFGAAAIFQESKYSNGLGIGLLVAFLLFKMVAQMGDTAEFLKFLTPLTLFDALGLVAYEQSAFIKMSVLLVGGMILYVGSIRIFCKKDLSL